MTISRFLLIIPITFFSFAVHADIDLSLTVHCIYQKGQFLSPNKSENIMNSKPMKWSFNGLLSNKAVFLSGGDSGRIQSKRIDNGVSIYLPFDLGVQTFTVWSSGDSYWNKQYSIMGKTNSQQYVGVCTN